MIKFTTFSLKNASAIILMVILLFAGGIYASTTLKVESMPDISFPVVIVSTQYQAPPKDVMEQVTKPLEKAVANVNGLKNLTSTSYDSYSQIVIELNSGKKPEDVKKDVESLVSNVVLPADAQKPKVMTFGFASSPVYFLALKGVNGMNQVELDKIYKDVIEPGFTGIDGVDHVDSIGNADAVIKVKLDANALTNYHLTPGQVVNTIKANLKGNPAGSVDFNGQTEMVRVGGNLDSIYNLDHLQIASPAGGYVELSQVGQVEAISDSTFKARLDGKPAIGINLYKTKNANTVEFGNAVDKLIAGWQKQYPDLKFQKIYNDASSIKESVAGMIREGGLGALLASLMILLFLRNFRMTAIVLVSIPLSIVMTLLMMAPLGITINIMTLGGMAIAVGRVVDDSIVVIENNFRLLVQAQERNESVIVKATKQVASAITSSTLTTVGVFAPIGFVSGVVGQVFRPFALTLACALLSSLLVALTVIPMLTKLLVLRSRSLPKHQESETGKMQGRYRGILEWRLNHRKRTLLLAFIIFIVTLPIFGILPKSFMPDSQADKQMYFTISMPDGTTFEMMDAKTHEIEQRLREAKGPDGKPLFTYTEALVGYNFGSGSDRTPNAAMLFTEVSKAANAKQSVKKYQAFIKTLLPPKGKVNGNLLSGSGGGGSNATYTYHLKGKDENVLEQAAQTIEAKMKTFPQLKDVKDSLGDTKYQVEIKVNPNQARAYGMTAQQILGTVHMWINEDKLDNVTFNNIDYTMKIGLDSKFKDSIDNIKDLPLTTADGTAITLRDVADVQQIQAPVAITREKQKQTVTISATIDSKDKGGTSAKVTSALNKVPLPGGISRNVTGVSQDIQSGFQDMGIAMLASIFIVYLIMVLSFGNLSAPFAILFSLPLAAIGGLIGLLVTGQTLNVTSLIGFLMLIGIVVTNAIVLVARVEQLREEGKSVREALVEAGQTRLRPIIMTAGATIIALIPLALGLSKGTLISQGLAVVVIGGLTTSTLLTLVIVPIVYEQLEAFKAFMRKLFHRKPKDGPPANDTESVRG